MLWCENCCTCVRFGEMRSNIAYIKGINTVQHVNIDCFSEFIHTIRVLMCMYQLLFLNILHTGFEKVYGCELILHKSHMPTLIINVFRHSVAFICLLLA